MTVDFTSKNTATALTYPRLTIVGPGKLIYIRNNSTLKTVVFDNFTIRAGETVKMDFDPVAIKMSSNWAGRTKSVLSYVRETSDIGRFYLRPGVNNISVYMTGTTSATRVDMVWTPLFWGLDAAVLR